MTTLQMSVCKAQYDIYHFKSRISYHDGEFLQRGKQTV